MCHSLIANRTYFIYKLQVKAEDLINAPSFDIVVAKLRLILRGLSSLPLLVGQSIGKDVEWLKLKQGEDFHALFDLAVHFEAQNPKYNSPTQFSLDTLALHLLKGKSPSICEPTYIIYMYILLCIYYLWFII